LPILNNNKPASEVLQQLAKITERFFVKRPDRHLIYFLGLESTCISPKIGKMIDDFFAAWHMMFYTLFEKCNIDLPSQQVTTLIEQTMILIQGFCTVDRSQPKRKRIKTSLSDYLISLWQQHIDCI
jgi:hypothetical protein